MWFRRDLRLADNPTWNAATSRHERVVALFVIDPELFHRTNRRSEHLLHQLRALDGELARHGGRLLVRSGVPDTLVAAEAVSSGSAAVYWNRDVSPYSVQRDAAVAASLPCPFDTWYGSLVHPPGRIRTTAAEPYRVFTPFYRRWLETPWDPWPQPGEAAIVADVGEGIPAPPGSAMVAAGAASRIKYGFDGEGRQRSVLNSIGLPVDAPDADVVAVREMMNRDKKRDADGIRMVLLRDFGLPELVHADDATVRAAFEGIGLS